MIPLPLAKDTIVAFDPGQSTGVVVIKNGYIVGSKTIPEGELLQSIAKDFLRDLAIECDTWVVESYVLYPWKAAQMGFDTVLPAQIIGMIRVAIERNNLGTKLVFQNAGTVKYFVTDDRLKSQGWWDTLKTPHERDAARHALYYLIQKQKNGGK